MMRIEKNIKSKKRLVFILILLLLGLTGCGDTSNEDELFTDSNEIAECYQKIYEQAVRDAPSGGFAAVKKIVECLGDAGYTAVDDANQVNMVHPEQVEEFVGKVKEGTEGEVIIICVSYNGGFTQYNLHTSQGKVFVTGSYNSYKEGRMEITSKEEYSAYSFEYSQDGYLFFEQYHMPGFDGPSGHTALRVKFLDDRCREMNRQYLLPIGYGSNNMFIKEWSEDDFGELNFYDLFHILYPQVYKKQIPYDISYEGKIYYVLQEEFENVIMSYFKIDSDILRSKTTYEKEKQVYQYRTRGFGDWGWNPNTPYPEVVRYEENADGTIKLIVNAVYRAENKSCAFTHELVVRPLTNGGVQYVSNKVISLEKSEPTWYIEKFTDEEWNELYGKQ